MNSAQISTTDQFGHRQTRMISGITGGIAVHVAGCCLPYPADGRQWRISLSRSVIGRMLSGVSLLEI